jgi:branched-chain amino acid transport system substrate-binding protein
MSLRTTDPDDPGAFARFTIAGAAYVFPPSTGITFALTERAPVDKIPIISMGYGRSESRDGSVFQWNFP